MYRSFFLLLFSLWFVMANAQKTHKYPDAPKDSVINIYFNDTISDPYQWMENPQDPRLLEWLEWQKKISKKVSSNQVNKWTLRAQLASLYNDIKEETTDEYVKKKKKDKWQFKYEAKEYDRSSDLLYRKGKKENYRYLIKIKDFQKEKDDHIVISNTILSPNQEIIAIEMSNNGSDWRETYFANMKSGKLLQDTLKYLRNGSKIQWYKNGVYYDGYDKPKEGRELLDQPKGQTLYYHKMGTLQSADKMCYQNPDTTGLNTFRYSKMDSTKLFFYHTYFTHGKIYNALSYAQINKDNSVYFKNFLIYPKNDSISFTIEQLIDTTVILSTTWNAPNGKIMKADINQLNKLELLVPEYEISLRSVNHLGKDKIACIYRDRGKFLVLIFNLKGELIKKIEFPEGKSVHYFYENNPKAEYTDFCISSFFHPDIWYQLNLKNLTFTPRETIWVPFDASSLETRYVKYNSKDGTQIPMYITCLKSTKLNGKNPTLLYGYGGYGKTVEPNFIKAQALWILHGGILAVPNIRGGSGEGNGWENAGKRLNKQNTFDDFIGAAEYLIQEKYTNPDKLAIKGASHGGLLIGAVLVQRPELFKAAIATAGVFDMLRFEKYTAGISNTNLTEFGDVNNFEDYQILKSYSPLQNIKDGVVYPNVLLITGDKDDRVPPFHSFKFLATLQNKGSAKSLYQLYIIPGASHSGALTNTDAVDELLFENYFLYDQLDLNFNNGMNYR